MALTPVQVGMPLDEFIRLYDTEGPFELVNGERIRKMPNVAGHGLCAETLRDAINAYAVPNQLGRAMLEQVFILSYTSNWVAGSRIPDVMYYAADRLEGYKATTPDWKNKPYILVPDLVAEVVSPNDNLTELDEKIDRYLEDRVRVVWVLDPQRAIAQVYTLLAPQPFTKQVVTLKSGDMLQGGEIIPGFEIAVVQLFA
jgi:Uma2 family endonuclease